MWICESGKDECVDTSPGPETACCRGTEFSRMGGYDFPGQISASDGLDGCIVSQGMISRDTQIMLTI